MIRCGIVIPVVKMQYLAKCVQSIDEHTDTKMLTSVIVNDGNQKIIHELDELASRYGWLSTLHLESNQAFAGANNAGWRYIISKHPGIEYSGTLNSDTCCLSNWLDELVCALDKNSQVAMVSPVQLNPRRFLGIFRRLSPHAVWRLGSAVEPMILQHKDVQEDVITDVLGGFCLLGRTRVLQSLDFFHPEYRNSCEDVDLSMRVTKAGHQLMVVARSRIIHYESKSRYATGTSTNLELSHQILQRRWEDLR